MSDSGVMRQSASIPPYEIPEQDSDLWECGLIESSEETGLSLLSRLADMSPCESAVLLDLLTQPGYTCEIAQRTDRSRCSVGECLKRLFEHGLVDVSDGYRRIYRLSKDWPAKVRRKLRSGSYGLKDREFPRWQEAADG